MARALPISLLAALAMAATMMQRPVAGQVPMIPLPFASMSPEMKAAREELAGRLFTAVWLEVDVMNHEVVQANYGSESPGR